MRGSSGWLTQHLGSVSKDPGFSFLLFFFYLQCVLGRLTPLQVGRLGDGYCSLRQVQTCTREKAHRI